MSVASLSPSPPLLHIPLSRENDRFPKKFSGFVIIYITFYIFKKIKDILIFILILGNSGW